MLVLKSDKTEKGKPISSKPFGAGNFDSMNISKTFHYLPAKIYEY